MLTRRQKHARERNQHRRTHEVQFVGAGRAEAHRLQEARRLLIEPFGRPPLRVGDLFSIRQRTATGNRLVVLFKAGTFSAPEWIGGVGAFPSTRLKAQLHLDRSFCGERPTA